jgi:hypothetical protein
MATKRKKPMRSKKPKKLPGIWQSLTEISYFGTLWRVVVFIGVWLAITGVNIAQGSNSTEFMKMMLEGLMLFIFAFAIYDGVVVAVKRRYPWHAKTDKVLLLGIEAALATWFLLAGALSEPSIFAGGNGLVLNALNNFFELSLFWILLAAAFWPPIRAFIGISHMAITKKG